MPLITTGTERLMLENMLDRNRRALIDTAQELSDADARRRLVASLTTPIGLIKHAAWANPNATATPPLTTALSFSPTAKRWPT